MFNNKILKAMNKIKNNLFSATLNIVKKGTVAILCIIGLVFVMGCKKDEPKTPEQEYPIEISFTEYSLEKPTCQWKNLPYNDKVIIINSDEELEQYVACIDGNCPAIDFSKYTLLAAIPCANNKVYLECNSLLQFTEQGYEMKVDVFTGLLHLISPWQVPIIVDKLDERCIIELTVTIKDIE
jgi:hypothetical protein